MLGNIRKEIENKTENINMSLYKSMVSPLYKYCMQFWTPHLKKDMIELQKVHRKTMKGRERGIYGMVSI